MNIFGYEISKKGKEPAKIIATVELVLRDGHIGYSFKNSKGEDLKTSDLNLRLSCPLVMSMERMFWIDPMEHVLSEAQLIEWMKRAMENSKKGDTVPFYHAFQEIIGVEKNEDRREYG